ncbi:hypothetical protein C6501_01295 [Candidatus Poribacteria bacterium]|nr:MAG: hypothetical protein C6501_01295 [Candidatus Poribacteria bacterium]
MFNFGAKEATLLDHYLLFSFPSFPKIRISLFILTFLSIVVFSVSAETPVNQITAYRTDESIEIDGDLTEADWQKAEVMDRFVQIEPSEGEASTEPMEVRILYDDENIYFGFICFDSDMSKLVANEMRRDARDIHENDNVFILLDTYNDKRSGFFFRANALGAVQDRAITNNGDTRNDDWDAVVACKSKINDTSWTTELSIPFSQLRFKKSDQIIWGINVGRQHKRYKEEVLWVPMSASYGGLAKYRTTNLGTLVGLKGIAPSRNIEFLPYFLPGITQVNNDDAVQETTREFKIGFDTKYGITSNLIADITYNTDFAQVEADQEQVNLTRFSLFFPEKRPFFLEGAGLFDFGIPRQSFRRPPPMLLFYSRRIGLAEGNAIPIIFGGKASGKIGSYGVGVLNVLTDEFYDEPAEDDPIDIPRTNYSAIRITKDAAAGTRFGVMAINKDEIGNYNRAGGFDFEFRPNDRFDVRGMWARTFAPDMSGKNNAWYFGTKWRNDIFRSGVSYTDIDEDFEPAAGYVRQAGIRQLRGDFRWAPRPQKYGIREIWSGPELNYILNQENELERWNFSYTHWTSFVTDDSIMMFVRSAFERLDEDFKIREDVVIPIGDYQYSIVGGRFSTSDSRVFSTTTGFELGNFYNGRIRKFYIDGSLKPSGRISLHANYQFNRVNLPAGDFDANLFSGRLNYSFSTTLFAKLFAQWNTETDLVSTNFLINYIYRPGSDFYFVFNQTYNTNKTTKTRLQNSTVVAKMTFWWNP